MKQCPYCAELIQDEAILCRYCGKTISRITDNNSLEPSTKKDNNFGTVLIGVGGVLGELYALYIVASEFGLIGAIAAFMFFPIAIIVAPIYALVVYKAWIPLLIVYGLIAIGIIINYRNEAGNSLESQ